MTIEIKDKEHYILRVLNSIGFRFDEKSIEILLNAIELAKEKQGNCTLSDIADLEKATIQMLEDKKNSNLE